MTITALPPVPDTSDPASFNSRADAFLGALPQFRTELNALEADLNNLVSAAYTTSSTTSLTVGTGTRSLTVQTGLGYSPGQTVVIARTSSPTTLMVGSVTSYTSASGALVVLIPTGGSSGSGTFTDWSVSLAPAGTAPVNRGYLAGLTLSTAGSSSSFGVAAGEAADSTVAAKMVLSSAYSKTTSAWAVGNSQGALDTATIANNTWYHAYLIQRPDTGVVDVLVSLSATAPTLPANYTLFRRIGSMKTDGAAQWSAFTQIGNRFLWNTGVADVAASGLGTTATLYSLTVPPISGIAALINATAINAAGWQVVVNSPLQAAVVASSTNANLSNLGNGTSSGQMLIDTNSSGQVRAVANTGSSTFSVFTIGWVDRRGRDS